MLEGIPQHWEKLRLKFLVESFYSGGTPSTEVPEYWDGDIPWVSPKDMKENLIYETEDHLSQLAIDQTGLRVLGRDHLLIVVRSGILRHSIPVARNVVPVAVNQDIKALACIERVSPEYIAYFIEGYQGGLLQRWRKPGTTVESLEYDYYANEIFPLPPLKEQSAITRLLDEKTAEIDALIDKKRRLSMLLAEKRAAIITNAVTKGLNPDAPMRGTGIDWLSQIPAHWECKIPLKYFVKIFGGMTPATANADYWDGDIPWVSPKDMKVLEILDTEDHVTDLALEETSLGVVREGCVLFVVRGMILAHTFPVAINRVPVTVNQDMKVLLPDERLRAKYLVYFLSGISQHVLSLVEASAHGTKALRSERWQNLNISLPPRNEQDEIVEWITRQTGQLDGLVASIQKTIEKLQEFRSALITSAVTGKSRVG